MKAPPGLAHLLLGQPDLAEQYMRALNLKGTLPSYSGPEFEPSITTLDLTDPEYDYLRRFNRYQGGASLAAVAAQFGYIALGRNGVQRDMLAVVETIIIANNNAAALGVAVFLSQNALFGVGSGLNLPMDDRASSVSGYTIGTFNSASNLSGGLFGVMNLTIPATSSLILPVAYVLTNRDVGGLPSMLYVQTNALNVQLAVTFTWKERALLASEVR